MACYKLTKLKHHSQLLWFIWFWQVLVTGQDGGEPPADAVLEQQHVFLFKLVKGHVAPSYGVSRTLVQLCMRSQLGRCSVVFKNQDLRSACIANGSRPVYSGVGHP